MLSEDLTVLKAFTVLSQGIIDILSCNGFIVANRKKRNGKCKLGRVREVV